MNRSAFTALALASAVAACQPPRQDAAANAAAEPTANQFANQIAALPEAQRKGAFMRAITDAGFSCQKIEQMAAHAPIEGRPAWTVTCDQGNAFVALAVSGDSLQIVPGRPADAPVS